MGEKRLEWGHFGSQFPTVVREGRTEGFRDTYMLHTPDMDKRTPLCAHSYAHIYTLLNKPVTPHTHYGQRSNSHRPFGSSDL